MSQQMACSCGKHKTNAGCKGAAYLSSRSRAQRQADGHRGGSVRAANVHSTLIARFAHLSRDKAIWAAWRVGLHSKRLRALRARRVTETCE